MIFVGDDWAEDHHDLYVMDEAGDRLAARRLPEGMVGIRQLQELIAEYADEPDPVVIGIETDRGLWVTALSAAGYQVFAVNPVAVARYRDRHHVSGAKSDASDAKLLADLVRTDRHNHRPIAGDSANAEAIKVLARTHQSLIWSRNRQTNTLRSALREYYPGALEAFEDLAHGDALGVLDRAPTPEQAARLNLTTIQSALKRGGRQRNIAARARQIQAALRSEQLAAPAQVTAAFAATTRATVGIITELNRHISELETALAAHLRRTRTPPSTGPPPHRQRRTSGLTPYGPGMSSARLASGPAGAIGCRGFKRGVAQLGSALRSGRRGRGFKSRHPDPLRAGQCLF
jgi:transposase